MNKGLMLALMLVLAGCASTGNQQDLMVTCPHGVSFYKKDYAPLDFPNEIFAEYGCKKNRAFHFDINDDGLYDVVVNTYYDKNNKVEAWWFFRVLDDDRSKATTWAFLKKIDKVAKIIWENKKLKKEQREWLEGIIQSINKALPAQ